MLPGTARPAWRRPLRVVPLVLLALVGALGPAGPARPAPTPDVGSAQALAAASDWPQLHHGPDRTGFQPGETRVTTTTVPHLREVRRYLTGSGGNLPPLLADGVLYTVGTGRLQAFDATGRVGCAGVPVVCSPLWSVPSTFFQALTVGAGRVVATGSTGVYVYDATACRTSPASCRPLWTTSTHTTTGPAFVAGGGSPLVSGTTLYVPGYGQSQALAAGGAYVAAFDLLGASGCSGTPVVCAPIWTTTGPGGIWVNNGSPAVVGNRLYLASDALFAFAADGTTRCAGAPRVCRPTSTGVLPTAIDSSAVSAPAVSGGRVFVPLGNGPLAAFDAAGSLGCSTVGGVNTCRPLWTSTLQSGRGTPAVAGGRVYVVRGGRSVLQAYDAAGVAGCSGAAGARTCAPVWGSSDNPSSFFLSSRSPVVGGGVVYAVADDGSVSAYDAQGRRHCATSGGSRVCSPIWSALTGFAPGDAVEVSNGVVIVNLSQVGYLLAYGLPPASPTGVTASPGAKGSLEVHLTPGDGNESPVASTTATCMSVTGARGTGTKAGSVAVVTVTGLTSGARYTCTATQKNPAGASTSSSPSASVVAP
ncbi:MAG: PQQ-binding-like beta-propeller repeat protein [Lapillicoccus sp.]